MRGDMEDVKHEIALLLGSKSAGANGLTMGQNLTAIDAEKADGLLTPAPATINETERTGNPSNGFPWVQLIGLETPYNQDDGPTLQEGTHAVAIVFLQVTDDEELVTKHIERLVKAARLTLWGTTFGGGINAAPAQVLREDYSDLAPTKDNAFLKGGRLFVAVPTLVQ
jgi:hypothetical protein